jgi:hypothetical protein
MLGRCGGAWPLHMLPVVRRRGAPPRGSGVNRPRPRRMSVLYGSVGKERREEERRWNERSWPLWMVSTN